MKLNAFFGSNQPVMRARTELQGALRFDNQLKRYQFEDMRLSGGPPASRCRARP